MYIVNILEIMDNEKIIITFAIKETKYSLYHVQYLRTQYYRGWCAFQRQGGGGNLAIFAGQ